MPLDSGAAWQPPSSNERRLSGSSEGSGGSAHSRATSDSADFLTTRPHTAAVLPGKPAANPLQFVRVGPAELGSRAREQLRRAERAKPTKLEEPEDWSTELDNWKSNRRQKSQMMERRVLEVSRMAVETSQPRQNYMKIVKERSGRRRNPIAVFTEDDNNDLSDLGIGTSSTKSSLSEDCDTHSLASEGIDLDKHHSDVDNLSNCDTNRKLGSSANEYDTCTTTTVSSPEPGEYTYEGAIEGYKSRIILQNNSTIVKSLVNKNNGNKIEEKPASFQNDKATDTKNIHKHSEQIEMGYSVSEKNKHKLPDIANKDSIKKRLVSSEKNTEEKVIEPSGDLSEIPNKVKPVKERLSSFQIKSEFTEKERAESPYLCKLSAAKLVKERLPMFTSQTCEEAERAEKPSIGKLNNAKLVQQRLHELNLQTLEEEFKIQESYTSFKDGLSSTIKIQESYTSFKDGLSPKIPVQEKLIKSENNDNELSKAKESSSGIETQMKSFCRSLDSLDINRQSAPNSLERIQSLEDFDCCEIKLILDTEDLDTEDSGIHTARDSAAPVDDIADLTQVASPIEEPMVEHMVQEYESPNEDGILPIALIKFEEPDENVETPALTTNQDIIIEKKEDIIVEEFKNQNSPANSENTGSGSNYMQAVSQPQELTVSEIQLDEEDDDTLENLDNQDSSVSLHEPVSNASEGDTMVFEEKMIMNLNEIGNNIKAGAGNTTNCTKFNTTNNSSNCGSMPMVIDALNVAFMSENDMYGAAFDLMPTNVLEPPKEKPPPPPTDEQDNSELLGNGTFVHKNSARRIKKEIRKKRAAFLGIEGQVDDSYLDADLTLAPKLDISSFLQEDTGIKKLLCAGSKDPGADVARGPSNEEWYKGDQSSQATSKAVSKQNNEAYDFIEISSDKEACKSSRTNKEKQKEKNGKDKMFQIDDAKIDKLKQILDKNKANCTNEDWPDEHFDDAHTKEVLRFERELLQLEQEELRRQRENLLRDQTRIMQKSVQDVSSVQSTPEKPALHLRPSKTPNPNYHSMPNLLLNESYTLAPAPTIPERPPFDENMKRKPFVSEEHIQRHFGVEESRKILYEERSKVPEVRRQVPNVVRTPQPVLPPKPKSRESLQREITMRSSRVPSAVEYVNVDRTSVQLRQMPAPPVTMTAPSANAQYHPMTRHTLQALSATPTPKLITNADWMQSRNRKPTNFNYNQHWLIQEAEQRRIEEQMSKMRPKQEIAPPAPAPPLHNRHQLSSSQQHLSQDLKRGVLPNRGVEAPRPEPPHEEKLLSVSGRRKCSHCGEELGRGAAMIIESLSLCYHVWCFTCAVCGAQLGDGRAGADVRVRGSRLHCHHCYSGDDGRKYSCV